MSGHGISDGIHSKTIRIRKNGSDEVTKFQLHSSLSLDHFLQAAGNVLNIRAEWALSSDGLAIDDLMYINDNDVIILSQTNTLIKSSIRRDSLINEEKQLLVGPYSICGFIGMGGFGEVHRGIHQSTKEQVALKFISKAHLRDVHDALKIQQECQTLLSLKHVNIIHMYAREETSQHWVLAFELMEGGDLHNYLCKRGGEQRRVTDVKLTNDEAKRVFQQIVSGVSYAHSKYIIHRDLKLENIFLQSDNLEKIKIGDFGLSDLFTSNRKQKFDGMGTLYILPPEVFQDGDADMGCHFDVWALGVLLLTMLNGRLPFSANGFNLTSDCQPSDSIVRNLIVSGKYELDRSVDPQAADLIQWMLHKDPLFRATVPEIVIHPWLCSSDFSSSDEGETTKDTLDSSTHYSNSHRPRQSSLPMVFESSAGSRASSGLDSNQSFLPSITSRGSIPGSVGGGSMAGTVGSGPSSLSNSKVGAGRSNDSLRRYSGNIPSEPFLDELDKSVDTSSTSTRKGPRERLGSERSNNSNDRLHDRRQSHNSSPHDDLDKLVQKSGLRPRIPSTQTLDSSNHELTRSTHGLQPLQGYQGLQSSIHGIKGLLKGGASIMSEKTPTPSVFVDSIDRFAMLSQSAKGSGTSNQLAISSKHLANLDDKLDTLGQSLHEAACVRKVDYLSKSLHGSSKGFGTNLHSAHGQDTLLSSSLHPLGLLKYDNFDEDLPAMKTLARQSSTVTTAPRRKGSYMDSTQTSLKVPTQYK